MAQGMADRVWEQTDSTGGTGALTLVGPVVGHKSFLSGWGASGDGDYAIFAGAFWETGHGTINAGGTTLTRNEVYEGSSGLGTLVNFPAGVKNVIGDAPAHLLKFLNHRPITVASAATTDIGAPHGGVIEISGAVTITSFGTVKNRVKFVRLTGAPLLTHSATLVLPRGVNIQGAAGDMFIAVSDGSATPIWRVRQYQFASGAGAFNGVNVGGALTGVTTGVYSDLQSFSGGANFLGATGVTFFEAANNNGWLAKNVSNVFGLYYTSVSTTVPVFTFSSAGTLQSGPHTSTTAAGASGNTIFAAFAAGGYSGVGFYTGASSGVSFTGSNLAWLSGNTFNVGAQGGGWWSIGQSGTLEGFKVYTGTGAAGSTVAFTQPGLIQDANGRVGLQGGTVYAGVTNRVSADYSQNEYGFVVRASHASVSNALLAIVAARAGSSAFNFVQAASSDFGDNEFVVRGDGVVLSDGGTAMSTPADYADYFEKVAGAPKGDWAGCTLVMEGEFVRQAKKTDDPNTIRGATSLNPSVVGNAGGIDRWSKKYLKDHWGRYKTEKVTVLEWEYEWTADVPELVMIEDGTEEFIETDKDGTPHIKLRPRMVQKTERKKVMKDGKVHRVEVADLSELDDEGKPIEGKTKLVDQEIDVPVPPKIVNKTVKKELVSHIEGEPIFGTNPNGERAEINAKPPKNAKRTIIERRVLNPEWDPNAKHESRKDRDEWVAVALVGRVPLLKSYPKNPRWVKLKELDKDYEEWLIQ
jgi:hypothetical protein